MDENEVTTDSELTEAFSPLEGINLGRRRQSEHHRRHEFPAERLQAYSDAVFAIVGTILIAYLQQTAIPALDDTNASLQQRSIDSAPLFTVYHFTFFHVSIIWLNHSRVFSVIKRANDVIVWLNMLLLYAVSFVPLTFGVLGEFNTTYHGILIPSVTLIAINVIMTIIVWYAYRKPMFLRGELSERQCTFMRRTMYANFLCTPLVAALAIGVGSISVVAARVLFYLSTVMLVVPRIVVYFVWKICRKNEDPQLTQVLCVDISKDRVEFFTDGIYSIVSTLVILDVTVKGIPTRELVDDAYDGNLLYALHDNHLSYLTYFTTFLIIGLLWFVHHSLFNFIKKLNPLMLIVHQCTCSMIGVVPPSVEVLSEFFDTDSSADEATAMQVPATILILIGTLKLVLLALMYFADSDCVDNSLFHNRASLHLFLKVLIIPSTGVIAYWSSMGPPLFRRYVFYIIYICGPSMYIVVAVAMKWGKLHSFFRWVWESVQKCLWEPEQLETEMEESTSYRRETENPDANETRDDILY